MEFIASRKRRNIKVFFQNSWYWRAVLMMDHREGNIVAAASSSGNGSKNAAASSSGNGSEHVDDAGSEGDQR